MFFRKEIPEELELTYQHFFYVLNLTEDQLMEVAGIRSPRC